MKKIYFNNRLAKILLSLSSCHTIMLFGFVVSKLEKERITKVIENHEFIHVVQYWVCFTIGSVLAIPLVYSVSWWFILLPALLYYFLYITEAGISFVHHFFSTKKKDPAGATDKAYRNSAMEMEAYANENNFEYLMTRPWWANFRYYGKL